MTSAGIVGAGPTGLTAAVELARRGVAVDVVEKRPDPSPLSRAVGILAPTMQILGPSGAAAAIEAEAVRFSAMIFFDGAERLAALPLNFDDESRIWGLPQDRTEAHLSEALDRLGGSVRYGTALHGFEQDEAGVTARIGDGEARYDWLIGADGVHSTVRSTLGVDYVGKDLDGDWSIADVDAPGWPDPTAFHGFLLEHGAVAIVVPLEAARFRVIASGADALAALPVSMPVTRVRRQGTFRISVRQAARYRVGRVFLAGDAAHCHSPFGGRGMNLGIADAADLAARIGAGEVDGYDEARRAAGSHVLRFTERGRSLIMGETAVPRSLVIAAIRAGDALPGLGRTMMRHFVSD